MGINRLIFTAMKTVYNASHKPSILGHSKVPIGSMGRARRRFHEASASATAKAHGDEHDNEHDKNASLLHRIVPFEGPVPFVDGTPGFGVFGNADFESVGQICQMEGIENQRARNAATPPGRVQHSPTDRANTFFEGIVMKWIAAKTTSIMNAYTYHARCTKR